MRVPTAFPGPGLVVFALGETLPELGGSEFAEVVLGVISGRPPALDLTRERALIDFLQAAAAEGLLTSAHDCADGGIAIALVECAILGGHGFAVRLTGDAPDHVTLFSESASRAVVSASPADAERLVALAEAHGVPIERIGETGGPSVMFEGMLETRVAFVTEVYETAIPKLLGSA